MGVWLSRRGSFEPPFETSVSWKFTELSWGLCGRGQSGVGPRSGEKEAPVGGGEPETLHWTPLSGSNNGLYFLCKVIPKPFLGYPIFSLQVNKLLSSIVQVIFLSSIPSCHPLDKSNPETLLCGFYAIIMPMEQLEDHPALQVNAGIAKCSLPPKQGRIAMLVQECTRNAEQLRCLEIWNPGNIPLKMAHSKAAQAQSKWKVQAGIIPPRYLRRELFPDWPYLTSSFVSQCSRDQLSSRRKEEDLITFKPESFAHIIPKARTLNYCCLHTLLQITSLRFRPAAVPELSAMVEIILLCIVQYGSHLRQMAI